MVDHGGGRKVQHVTVAADRAGQRLDNFLIGQLDGVPRSLVYRLVRTGQVRVNGSRAKPMKKLHAGDEVRIPPVATEAPRRGQVPDGLVDEIRRRILYRDSDMVVLDKPAGLAVHGGSGLSYGLMDAVQAMDADWKPVHRLDRPTSGLLLLACHHQAVVAMQRAFAAREVDKRYLALLRGELAEDRIRVDAPLKKIRDGSGQRQIIVADDGQPAVSVFRCLERLAGYTFVEVVIETGRTHQIRAHARHLGHPVAGDDLYDAQLAPAGLKRLFLHAHYLRLRWPEDHVFSAPLPDELGRLLDHLRGQPTAVDRAQR
ncbi:MAG: RluA family pseudouridine synthase [Wenzhouxiangella sp.]|nr:MAG: RluA family pseudouridine synthase [Wenzhouxiangella sp.]